MQPPQPIREICLNGLFIKLQFFFSEKKRKEKNRKDGTDKVKKGFPPNQWLNGWDDEQNIYPPVCGRPFFLLAGAQSGGISVGRSVCRG